tara:strand:- start:9321 stop:9596 length:276 start_codon:yes stop_codon:yes gene_type:complete
MLSVGGKIAKGAKAPITTNLDVCLLDAVRNCIAAQRGTPHELRLSDFFDNAVRVELQRQRDLVNGGRTFPKRKEEFLRAGRPRKRKRTTSE